ncbi:MAG: hypothetical protein H0X42_10575 [Solirubrobacterales bacterium]|nr:hypothetical protein [Solirubrobacterales bacterium]
MRKVIVVAAALLLALLAAVPASAFEGGGRSPSAAPLIAYGQHYTGQLNNHREDANYTTGEKEVALWRLPPVSTRDTVVVNWHALPFTHSTSYPICLMLVQGVNDFSWGSTFNGGSCYEPAGHALAGSGTAATSITIQNTDSSATYLEFWSRAEETQPSAFETYPYDFSVEAPRHALTLNLPAFTEVAANGMVHASVTGATGLPAPDGLIYGLTVRWHGGGIATYTAASIGGQIAFQLALPESALNQRASFVVGRGPDAQYQAAEAPVVKAKVTSAVLPAPSSACKKAAAHAHILSRQQHRLQAHSRRARGIQRVRLRHRAHHVGIELRKARSKAAAACA